jgi:hypothetical protein
MSFNLIDNNLDVTFIADREIENYAQAHPGQHINSDIFSLREMGFDKKMINKVYILLMPPNIQTAIDYMTDINGIIQHNFFENRAGTTNRNLCYICKRPRNEHIGYNPGDFHDDFINNIDNDIIKETETPQNITCKVCFEPLSKKEVQLNSLPCGHYACTSCWSSYLLALISEAKVEELKCIDHTCNDLLSEEFIMKFIKNDKKLVGKYQKFKNRANILKDPNKKLCPKPDCESYLEKSSFKKYVKCKNGHEFCFECLRPPHGSSTCENMLEKDFLIWKKDKVVKRCPKCKIFTEKNEGCNHMTCTSCKYQWCWLCLGEYKYGHYDSGRCSGQQFTKANSIEDIEEKRRIRLEKIKNLRLNRTKLNTVSNNNNNNNIALNVNSNKKKKVYFGSDEEDQNCCCSLSSIFPYCLHKVSYLKIDIDGTERLNALFIWFLGYFLFVAYQMYNTSRDDFLKYSSVRCVYLFFGMLISFCLFICYEIMFTVLITPFILFSCICPFCIYRIKMFFTIGNAHYFNKTNANLIN